ncbi:MAG: hypothetical protein IT429_14825 [Gemmataceae bacterium]|nr:hypothetical protein [Gemmataceae bacterium]
MTRPLPAPESVHLHLLPCGRTLVEDTRAPSAQRWRVLRPGWQDAIEPWREDLAIMPVFSGAYYLHWWCALAVGRCSAEVSREEMARLIGLANRGG